MTWDEIQSNWNQWTGRVKEKWAQLTDDDLGSIEGRRDKFVRLLQKRYGYSRNKADKALDEFSRELTL